jgi:two-component system, cell cycle response regulator DivK
MRLALTGRFCRITGDRMPAAQPLILIVDDFKDNREMYCEYLAFSGFRVLEAGNGREAVEQALANLPDLIIMDLSLPVMDGWEATRQLKRDERTRAIPVVALTGHAVEGRSKDAGCDGYLSKPCLPDQLVAEIRRVLALPRDRPGKG